MSLTHHAGVRARQRGIPPLVVDVLQSYGASIRRHGVEIYFLDKEGRRRAESYLGRAAKQLSQFLDTYIVVADDGDVVTRIGQVVGPRGGIVARRTAMAPD